MSLNWGNIFAESEHWVNQDINNIWRAAGKTDQTERDRDVTIITIGRREELRIAKGCHNKPWKKHTEFHFYLFRK